jgi:hypothetical protein
MENSPLAGGSSSIFTMLIFGSLQQHDYLRRIPMCHPQRGHFYGGASPVWPDRPRDYAHLHAVDGGYFDNSGLVALTEWLNEALEERANVHRQPAVPEKILGQKRN